ncbi:hypothetical protein I549_2664 [Mycobacterium avium subsp. avium 2285 (R)]|nr:hypothetical protein I549_2664 [Mycobacterium avium subsp. avium 2285 (R)]
MRGDHPAAHVLEHPEQPAVRPSHRASVLQKYFLLSRIPQSVALVNLRARASPGFRQNAWC